MATAPSTAAATVAPEMIGTVRGLPRLTGRWNSTIGHSRSSAILRRSFSGLTATGLPTVSIIGRSVIESEYAYDPSRSMPSRSANW